MIEKVCEVCGAEFSVKPSRATTAKYCSRKCSDEAKKDRVKRICKVCGKEFESLPSRIKAGRGDCCSIDCRTIFRTNRIQVKCAECGKVFESVKSHVEGRKNKYCSRSCYAKAKSKSMSGPNNPHWKETKLTHECDWCGKLFEITPSRLKNNNTSCCSEECRRKLTSQIYRGENHHAWRGGISFEPYCPKFTEEFKERVREFWGRKCGICGDSEEANGKRLSVHHVNYDKMVCCNTTSPLFIPVDMACHARTNNKRDYWEEILTNYIMIWFDGESYNPVTNEIAVVNEQEITA